MPLLSILAVPNQFRYPVSGQEPGSLTYRYRRLLTQKLIFSPAYYFTWPDYLHTSLFIPIYQTSVGIMSPVEIAKEATNFQYKLWENNDLTEQPVITYIYLCQR